MEAGGDSQRHAYSGETEPSFLFPPSNRKNLAARISSKAAVVGCVSSGKRITVQPLIRDQL